MLGNLIKEIKVVPNYYKGSTKCDDVQGRKEKPYF